MQPIHLHFDSGCGHEQNSRILTLLTNLNERQERLMQEQQSAFQRLDARIAKIESGVAEMKDRIQTDFDYLKTQLNSGNQISVTELETLEARLNNIISVMTEVDPIPEIPTPEVPVVQAQPVVEQGSGNTNEPIIEQIETQTTEPLTEPIPTTS